MLYIITANNFNTIHITNFAKDRRGKNEDFVTFDVSTTCKTQTIPDKTNLPLFKSHKIFTNRHKPHVTTTGFVPGRRPVESRAELPGRTPTASAVRYFAHRLDDSNAEVT